jgi:hypothetical protein
VEPEGAGEDKIELSVMRYHDIVELYNPTYYLNLPVRIDGRDGKPDVTLLSFYGSWTLENNMSAPIVEIDRHTYLTHPERLSGEWAWTPWWESTVVQRFGWYNLQLYGTCGDWVVGKVDFKSTGWKAYGEWQGSGSFPSDEPTSWELPWTLVPENGTMSLLYIIRSYATNWHLDLSAKHTTIRGINFTIMRETLGLAGDGTKMVGKFTDGWENVENAPEIVFEAPSVEDIEFRDANGQLTDPPSTVTVKKNVFHPGGVVPAPKEDKGLSTGVIVGIVIAAIAVVVIGVVCVWYFAIRPSKEPVEAASDPAKSSPENPAQNPSQNPQQTIQGNPQQNAQQYPQQNPQQYAPQQYAQPNPGQYPQQYPPQQYPQQYPPQQYPQQYPPQGAQQYPPQQYAQQNPGQ